MKRSLLLALLLVVVGCGAPAEDSPRPLPDGVRADFSGDAGDPAEPSAPARAHVYFLADDKLIVVRRPLPDPRRDAGDVVEVALSALLAGPTPEESATGITTAVGGQTRLLDVNVRGRVADIDVSDEFAAGANGAQVLAVAQLVYTATAVPEVAWVRLSIDGEPATVPTESGELTTALLRRADYASFAPPR